MFCYNGDFSKDQLQIQIHFKDIYFYILWQSLKYRLGQPVQILTFHSSCSFESSMLLGKSMTSRSFTFSVTGGAGFLCLSLKRIFHCTGFSCFSLRLFWLLAFYSAALAYGDPGLGEPGLPPRGEPPRVTDAATTREA